MRTDYVVVHVLTDDLVVLRYLGPTASLMKKIDAAWRVVRATKDHKCAAGWGDIHKGIGCWSPLTNGNNRYHRISAAGMAHLVASHLMVKTLKKSSGAGKARVVSKYVDGWA